MGSSGSSGSSGSRRSWRYNWWNRRCKRSLWRSSHRKRRQQAARRGHEAADRSRGGCTRNTKPQSNDRPRRSARRGSTVRRRSWRRSHPATGLLTCNGAAKSPRARRDFDRGRGVCGSQPAAANAHRCGNHFDDSRASAHRTRSDFRDGFPQCGRSQSSATRSRARDVDPTTAAESVTCELDETRNQKCGAALPIAQHHRAPSLHTSKTWSIARRVTRSPPLINDTA